MNDGSTCISYRGVIRGEGRLFCVRRVKRETKSWSFTRRDPSWCSDEVIYRFLSWNISVPQDSSPLKVTHELFFTLCLPERGALTQALSTFVDLLLPKYVSNCSHWSWIPLFCILFGIEQQNKRKWNTFLLALQKKVTSFLFYHKKMHFLSHDIS